MDQSSIRSRCLRENPAGIYETWLDRTHREPRGGSVSTISSIDEAKLEQFMGMAVNDMSAAISALMNRIGERCGLYKAMAHAGPLTSQQVAERAGCDERYVREWLSNQ